LSTLLSFFRPRPTPRPTLFPYTTLFRSRGRGPMLRDGRGGSSRSIRRSPAPAGGRGHDRARHRGWPPPSACHGTGRDATGSPDRSEEHTSELQSRENLVCRLLLEKKKNQ